MKNKSDQIIEILNKQLDILIKMHEPVIMIDDNNLMDEDTLARGTRRFNPDYEAKDEAEE